MATIQHKSADRTVANIAARNGINPRQPHMTVLVLDAIGDPFAGTGRALYRWIEESQTWYLITKDNAESFTLADEEKTISADMVQASFIPASGVIWDVYVETANKVIYQVEYSVSGSIITINPDTPGQFDGAKLRFKYAYGSLSQQVEFALDFKADKDHDHTPDEIIGLEQMINAAIRPEYHSITTPGALEVFVGTSRWYLPYAATLTGLHASVGTVSAGGPVRAAVRKNGGIVASVEIIEGAYAASSASATQLAQGDYLTVDVEAVGASSSGADLVLTLILSPK